LLARKKIYAESSLVLLLQTSKPDSGLPSPSGFGAVWKHGRAEAS
jgi:hypothetical protein